MAITAPTPDQVFMGMMQRSTASLHPFESVSNVSSVLEGPSAHGRGAGAGSGAPGFGRYWSRSSWSSCLVDNAHLGLGGQPVLLQQQQPTPPQTSTLGMQPFASASPTVDQFASFGAGKYNIGLGGGEIAPFSLEKPSICEPASGGASSRTVQQPLLEAVEGIAEASTMVEAAAAKIAAAATYGHVEVTTVAPQQENANTNNSSCSEHAHPAPQQDNTKHSSCSKHSHPSPLPGVASPAIHSPPRSPSHNSHHPGTSRKRKKDLPPPDPNVTPHLPSKCLNCLARIRT